MGERRIAFMSFGNIIVVAFVVAIICYFIGLIWTVHRRGRIDRRVEIAKRKGWHVQAYRVKGRIVDVARGKDYRENKPRLMHKATYEYEIEGITKQFKISSYNKLPLYTVIYYDAEDKNKILNIENNSYIKWVLLIPVVVFVMVVVILRNLFQV